MHGLVGPSTLLLPASEITLMYFASHLANTVSYETVKLYLVAVQDLDYHQQAGRAGRDGNTSDIVVIYRGQQLSHCEEDVKSFVRSDDC